MKGRREERGAARGASRWFGVSALACRAVVMVLGTSVGLGCGDGGGGGSAATSGSSGAAGAPGSAGLNSDGGMVSPGGNTFPGGGEAEVRAGAAGDVASGGQDVTLAGAPNAGGSGGGGAGVDDGAGNAGGGVAGAPTLLGGATGAGGGAAGDRGLGGATNPGGGDGGGGVHGGASSGGAAGSMGGANAGGAGNTAGGSSGIGGAGGVEGGSAGSAWEVCGLSGVGGAFGHPGGAAGDGPACVDVNEPTSSAGAAPVLLGQPCTSSGALACNGADQVQALICRSGAWTLRATCAADDERCDSTSGVCATIVSECASRQPSEAFCEGQVWKQCGPDRVTVDEARCCGGCSTVGCAPPECGDGYTQVGEDCDDGNTVGGDGCEADCTRSSIVALAAGEAHTCGLTASGTVRCWGRNGLGQLGLGHREDATHRHPYELGAVQLGGGAIALAAGDDHTCALMASGTVQCWGGNDDGQLGLGHTEPIGDDEPPSAAFSTVALDLPAAAIAAKGSVSCALLEDESVRCWGRNEYGQLGLGHTESVGDDESPIAAVAAVALGEGAIAIATSGLHGCAILASHRIRCWGNNELSQLGLGTTENVGDDELPVDVPPIEYVGTAQAYAIQASHFRTCSLRDDGYVRCFGYNGDGGMGHGFVSDDRTWDASVWGALHFDWPAVALAMGGAHTCVQLQNVETRCWGINTWGQLGLGTTTTVGDDEEFSLVPAIDFGTDALGHTIHATVLATGSAHTCAFLSTGELRCWGDNTSGQLGLGCSTPASATPLGGSAATRPVLLDSVQVFPSR